MKTLRTKVIQTTTVLLGAAFIVGCGGGGGGSLAQNAIDLIADYAQSNANPVPGNLDYHDAGITGVSNDNLDAVNAMVDKGVRSDYDTAAEIQSLVNLIGAKAVPDRNFGDGVHDFIYGVVTNATTGETWLNNNLGARYADANDANFDPQQQATSPTDFLAYGSLFQWGRRADGHELMNRTGPHVNSAQHGSTAIKSNHPGNALFIRTSADWRINPSSALWAGATAINSVCPVGYRLPWGPEISAERLSWGTPYNMGDAFASTLKWTYVGYRNNITSNVAGAGINAYYWIAHTNGNDSYYTSISSIGSTVTNTITRGWGFAVRCIKN